MSDYTPTTEDVAVCYMAAGALRTSRREHDALMEAGERYRPEFDRWLAEHDREKRAELIAHVRGLVKFCYPDDMTPMAARTFERAMDDWEQR